MVISGINLYKNHIEAIAAVSLTQKTYEAIREEYNKKDADREAQRKKEEEETGDGEADSEESKTISEPGE